MVSATYAALGRASCAIPITLALLCACATRPVVEWQDETYRGPIRDVLIIGVSERAAMRQLFEQTFVDQLAERGVAATASMALLGTDEKISRETVKAAIAGKSIDTVLVTRLIGVEQRESYHQPTASRYYRNYYTYYSQSWHYAHSGYYRRYDVLKLETNVYDVKTEQLVWSMQSESVDPQSATQVIEEQIALTIRTLSERGLL